MTEKYAVLIQYKYLDYVENAKLSDADAWKFLKGIIEYDKTGKEPEYTNPVLSGIFAVVKIDLDKNRESYEAMIQERSDAGKKGAEKRWGKNGKNSKSHENIAKMANATGCYENIAKIADLDLDNEFGSDLDSSSGSAERRQTLKTSGKPKKNPLREREPKNDMERIEKAYILNWDTLHAQGKVKAVDPIVKWGQARNLLKTHLKSLSAELLIQAVNNALDDEWVLDAGYSLSTILTASVLNRLINGNGTGPQMHRIAADNVEQGKASSYFREAK